MRRVTVFFVRHGFSCTNSIDHFGRWYQRWQTDFYTDPQLTSLALHTMPRPHRPRRLNAVFCSTLRRAQETALHLFPERRVHVIPFVKEVGPERSNQPLASPEAQRQAIGPEARRLDYAWVTTPEGAWRPEARQHSYLKFKTWLAAWARRQRGRDLRIAVVTHSDFMSQHVFQTPNGPRNVGIGVQILEVGGRGPATLAADSPVVTDFERVSEGVPFLGVDLPRELRAHHVARCDRRVR